MATLNILDALGEQKILSLKEKLAETSEGLFWDFSNFLENSFMFSPSAVLVPSLNFIMQLKLEEISSERASVMRFPDFFICVGDEKS